MMRFSMPALPVSMPALGVVAAALLAPSLAVAAGGPASSAHARDGLAGRLGAHPVAPEVAISCAPSETVFGLFGAALQGQPGMDEGARALVAAVASRDGLQAVGIDPDGGVALSLWEIGDEPQGVLSLPYTGDAGQAAETLAAFGVKPEVVQPGLGEWRTADGTVVRLGEGSLDLAFAGEPPAEGPGADLPLVAGLPDGPGCAVWAQLPGEVVPGPEALRPQGALTMAGFVPFARGGTAIVRVRPQGPPPAALSMAPAAPVSGSSLVPPTLVLHIGVSLADLLSDPAVQRAVDLSDKDARRIAKRLRIGAGTTIAAFGNPAERRLVAVIPIDDGASDQKHTKRVARLAKKADMDVVSKGERSLVLGAGGSLVFTEFRDGRAYAGIDAGLVREAAAGEGEAWVGPDELQWLMKWPVAAVTPGPIGGAMGARVHAGLRAADDGVFELGIQVKTSAPPGAIAGFLTQMLSSELPLPGAGGTEAPVDDEGLLPPPMRGEEPPDEP